MYSQMGFHRVAVYALSLCFTVILFAQIHSNETSNQLQLILSVVGPTEENQQLTEAAQTEEPKSRSSAQEKTKRIEEVDDFALNEMIRQVLGNQREIVRDEMRDYQYPNGKYNKSAAKLGDLVIEENGKPIRSIIITTWRSGSTFLGDVISAHPANFYTFEPLMQFGPGQVRGAPLNVESLKIVKALLNCNYEDTDGYMEFTRTHRWVLNHNTYLKKQCHARGNLCSKHEFLSALCKLFPFQSMKLVRLRLNVAQELLADEDLAIRMVLLVRDPRGTMRSRKREDWCLTSRDCADPSLLCADMVSDYKLAVKLQKKYPSTFRVIRYEDFSAKPYETVQDTSEFFGLDFHPNIKKFLDTHTKRDNGGTHSTYRDTKMAPYHWRTELEFEEVEEIQRSCAVAMEHWGYLQAMNASHQKEFNPVADYVLN